MRRCTILVAVLSILCLALALTALADESKKEESKKEEATPAGQQVFSAQKCQMCHTVYSAGVGEPPKKESAEEAADEDTEEAADEAADEGPPDLSLTGTGRTAESLSLFLQKKETLNEKKHMLKFKGADEDLAAVVSWLLTLKAPEVEAAPAKTGKVEKAAEPAAPTEPEAPAEPEVPVEPDKPVESDGASKEAAPASGEAEEAPAADAERGE